mgnify:FL=1
MGKTTVESEYGVPLRGIFIDKDRNIYDTIMYRRVRKGATIPSKSIRKKRVEF